MAETAAHCPCKINHSDSNDDPKLPDELNEFYCRFDETSTCRQSLPTVEAPPSPPFVIEEHEVRCLLRNQNSRKAADPEIVSSAILKWCAADLATGIFNCFINLTTSMYTSKSALIIPVPKKAVISCLNDYRPVALTSVVMNVFEYIVCKHLSSAVLDSSQFSYRSNRLVDDAVSRCLAPSCSI